MTKIAFMFPGQGSFQLGMGRDIAEAEPEAMSVYEQGSAASGLDLRQLCFEGSAEELTRTDLQQPALVATSLAINAALQTRGIVPDYVVGHSVGEFSALGAASSLGIRETTRTFVVSSLIGTLPALSMCSSTSVAPIAAARYAISCVYAAITSLGAVASPRSAKQASHAGCHSTPIASRRLSGSVRSLASAPQPPNVLKQPSTKAL